MRADGGSEATTAMKKRHTLTARVERNTAPADGRRCRFETLYWYLLSVTDFMETIQ